MPSARRRIETPLKPVWLVPGEAAPGKGPGKHFVDFQNDVTAADIALAAREGFRSVEHVKRYTTIGMGTDQGKTSNVNALALLSDAVGARDRRDRHHDLPAALHRRHLRRAGGRWRGASSSIPCARRRCTTGMWRRVRSSRTSASGSARGTIRAAGEDMQTAVRRECLAVARRRRHLRRLDPRQDRDPGPRCRHFPRPRLHQRFESLAIGRCRYGLMCRRRRHGLRRRRDDAPRRRPLLHDHHDRRRGARASTGSRSGCRRNGRS